MPPATAATRDPPSQKITQQIIDFLSEIPTSREHAREHPHARAEEIALAARRKAFLMSSSLALPPGPLGWLTLLPEMRAVWGQQTQMVADIAGSHGRHADLTP